jgi:hypothetical protein
VATALDNNPKQTPDLPPWIEPAVLDALADALADRLAARILDQLRPVQGSRVLKDDDLLDSREAIDYCRIPSLDALHRLTAAGSIPSQQRVPGGRLKFRKRDLDDWLDGSV